VQFVYGLGPQSVANRLDPQVSQQANPSDAGVQDWRLRASGCFLVGEVLDLLAGRQLSGMIGLVSLYAGQAGSGQEVKTRVFK
jgi:hypothetical protein